jgi:hypothetical protein
MVVFGQVKDGGNAEGDWEDGAGYRVESHAARCIAADGAAQAFGAIRWVSQLVESFLGVTPDGPEALDADHLDAWFVRMQQAWTDHAVTMTSGYARKRAAQGSFATVLACQIDGLDTGDPGWTAAALGDTVLFHVRDGRLLEHFPPMRPEDFSASPAGMHTLPTRLPRMRERLLLHGGRLQVGDRLYLATDALAEWLLRTDRTDGEQLWPALDHLSHDAVFTRIVADQRAAGALRNDDTTLLRAQLTSAPADALRFAR